MEIILVVAEFFWVVVGGCEIVLDGSRSLFSFFLVWQGSCTFFSV